jgi:S1-C subfamily serine protease
MRRGFIKFDSLFSARNRCVEVSGSLNGTGVIIETGLVFTNFHLIEHAEDHAISVNGEIIEKVLYFDYKFDFAALAVKKKEIKPVVIQPRSWSNQPVFYVGNPGEKVKAIQLGRIISSGWGRIEIAVECETGFSGSALYNLTGQMIGLTDSFDEPSKDRCCIGYAIPGARLVQFYAFVKNLMG